MTDKIGDYSVVHNSTLIIPQNETARTKFSVGLWSIQVEISFRDTTDSDGKGEIKIQSEGNSVVITFINWDNSLGTSLVSPANLGTASNGKKLNFMVAHWRIGQTNKLDIQFLLEGDL